MFCFTNNLSARRGIQLILFHIFILFYMHHRLQLTISNLECALVHIWTISISLQWSSSQPAGSRQQTVGSRQQVVVVPPIDFYSRVFNSRNQQAEITYVCLFILSFVSFFIYSDSSSFFLLALCSALFDSRWSYQRFVLWGIKNLSFPHPTIIWVSFFL